MAKPANGCSLNLHITGSLICVSRICVLPLARSLAAVASVRRNTVVTTTVKSVFTVSSRYYLVCSTTCPSPRTTSCTPRPWAKVTPVCPQPVCSICASVHHLKVVQHLLLQCLLHACGCPRSSCIVHCGVNARCSRRTAQLGHGHASDLSGEPPTASPPSLACSAVAVAGAGAWPATLRRPASGRPLQVLRLLETAGPYAPCQVASSPGARSASALLTQQCMAHAVSSMMWREEIIVGLPTAEVRLASTSPTTSLTGCRHDRHDSQALTADLP